MLTWNVLVEDFNRKEIVEYNIFNHFRFLEDIKKEFKKYKRTKVAERNIDQLKDKIKTNLRYYFWSKCEWEVIISNWPPSNDFKDKKIDVYDQVMLNFDIFFDYLFNNKKELEKDHS